MSADADTMRRAAARMRALADAATQHRSGTPWMADMGENQRRTLVMSPRSTASYEGIIVALCHKEEDAAHVSSWDPTVARAIADVLDAGADEFDDREKRWGSGWREKANPAGDALANLAYTYLGETADEAVTA